MPPTIPDDSSPSSPRTRRPRYRGTHPQRYDERYKELRSDAFPEVQAHVIAQGRTPAGTHVPVLLSEVVQSLAPSPGDVVVDCTVGYGGHAVEFLKRIGPAGRLIGLDVDASSLERARPRLAGTGVAFSLHRGNFAGIRAALAAARQADTAHRPHEGCDIIFADLGVSSMQVDDPARGFSYKHDGPLDMRMDDRQRETAADLLARLPFERLSTVLLEFADEPHHEQIARRIVQQRKLAPLTRTRELVQLVLAAKRLSQRAWRERVKSGAADPHPAALTFQALRMLVNDELAALEQLLRDARHCLRPGGRIGIISFHSGEDRLVKHAFREGRRAGIYAAICGEVIRPGAAERRANPRSASAKFRWARTPPTIAASG